MKEIDMPSESPFGSLEVEDSGFLEDPDSFLLPRNPKGIPELLGGESIG